MTHQRFVALVEAYGGRVDRWPAAEQAAAFAYLDTHPLTRGLLAQAAPLDAMLACWTVPGPGAVLAARITGMAKRRRRLRLWLSGLGAAVTLAGGLATGASVVAFQAPPASTAFGFLYQLSVLGTPVELAEHSAAGNVP